MYTQAATKLNTLLRYVVSKQARQQTLAAVRFGCSFGPLSSWKIKEGISRISLCMCRILTSLHGRWCKWNLPFAALKPILASIMWIRSLMTSTFSLRSISLWQIFVCHEERQAYFFRISIQLVGNPIVLFSTLGYFSKSNSMVSTNSIQCLSAGRICFKQIRTPNTRMFVIPKLLSCW